MDISKNIKAYLKEGQLIKNYKDLCDILHIEPLGGESKKAQIKELSRNCRYINQGHKFLIQEIYNIPLEKKDKRTEGNNQIYVNEISKIVLHLLFLNKGALFTTKKKLFLSLGMCNQKYLDLLNKKNIESQSKILTGHNISEFEINDFQMKTKDRLTQILFSSLNHLNKKGLIEWKEVVCVVDEEEGVYQATEEQVKEIEKIKEEVMRELEEEYIFTLIKHKKLRKYYNLINDKLYELQGYTRTFNAIDIKWSSSYSELYEELRQEGKEIVLLKSKVNENILNMSLRESKNTYNRLFKKRQREIEEQKEYSNHFGEFIPNEKLLTTKISEQYIPNRDILNKFYIKI